ncbi:TonB-dependent receptor [Pedobacter hiemivivus]|uniref:TonB-dependent receptor n=1 Tax=Pedobacter hiemivivus TaxID=2530454 RepID=A0A4U1GIB5_9SPHI|nr:TonB-dependent receptor [Pedobacter hiemivivus]TKC64017.1 TonB-dependent receptor [Pedobacter hiemivivus]
MSYWKSLLLFLFSSISLHAFSQNSTVITGYIKDGNQVIAGASIMIKGGQIGTTSNATGYYEFNGLKPGSYTIIVSYLGYIKASKSITLSIDQNLNLNFSLKKDQQQLQNVSINGKTKNQEVKESGFAVNAIETRKYANTTADLNQILNRTTGVKIREQGGLGSNFNFSINGLSGKQVRFFLDGVPMESFGGAMSLNNIPVNLAERIEVYKGVVPVELGSDALGGAVNVITDQHTKRFLDASYSYGSFNTTRAALTGRFTDDKTGLMFNFSGFHNYSDNDYMMRNNPKYDAAIKVTENNEVVLKDARRFHDAYRSTMGQMDVGVNNKSWADKFTLGFMYSNQYKEIQTGASQNKVFGALHTRGNFFMPSVKYKKSDFLIKGLTANIVGSLSLDRSDVVDTASNFYGWEGKGKEEAVAGELRDIKTIYHYKNTSGIVRANFNYKINDNQDLNLNYTYNHFGRSAVEDLKKVDNNSFDIPNTIDKTIIGLAHQSQLLDKRLTNTVFAKFYRLGTFVRNAVYFSRESSWVRSDTSATNNYLGYGIASRYKLTKNAGIKFSYEHAYRLQEGEELFGNGINTSSNPKLKPEKSDNINVGAYYNHQINKHKFAIEGSYFFRNAKDFIYSSPNGGGIYTSYQNVGMARIQGAETELRYGYDQLLDLSVNGSYHQVKNNQRYVYGTDKLDQTYGDNIPNQPWLYGNANLGIGKNDLIGKNTRIQFNWYTQYVHWFYLNWESRGSKESNNKIPQQLSHNAALSYSFQNGKYNISAECINLTDELTYDNFRLQKPGRSFFMKLRYFIK